MTLKTLAATFEPLPPVHSSARITHHNMSMRSLESAICLELRRITKRPSLRIKDIMEWSTSEAAVRKNAQETEEVIHCPLNGVWAAIPKKPNDQAVQPRERQ